MTTQKGQRRKKSARGLKNISILPENLAEGLGSRRALLAGVTYLSLRIHTKSSRISPLEVTVTLLSGSRKGTVGA